MADEDIRSGCLKGAGTLAIGVMILVARAGDSLIPSLGRSVSHGGDDILRAAERASLESGESATSIRLTPHSDLELASPEVSRAFSSGAQQGYEGKPISYSVDELRAHHPYISIGNQFDSIDDVTKPKKATYKVFIVAPENMPQAERIFTSSADPAYSSRAVLDGQAARRMLGSSAQLESNAHTLLQNVKGTDEDFIAIIGHNQSGKIAFPDGTNIDLRYLSKECKRLGKFCVMLSCKSKYMSGDDAAGMYVRLTYRDAAIISNQIKAAIAKARNGKIAPVQLERNLRAILIGNNFAIAAHDNVKVVYVLSSIGVGLMLISVDPD